MRALNLLCSIGSINISNKAIKEFSMDRNYADTSNKFSMTIIDAPDVAFIDLELYMNAGYRTINVAYSDNGVIDTYNQFSGQIWDYVNTFVGDKKSLQITGYLTRTVRRDYGGQASYNIDWNEYYNARVDETKFWNVIQQQLFAIRQENVWANYDNVSYDTVSKNNNIIYADYRNLHHYNSVYASVKGPSGNSVLLGVPDVFTSMQLTSTDESTGKKIPGDEVDVKHKFWGELKSQSYGKGIIDVPTSITTSGSVEYDTGLTIWRDKSRKIRAFTFSSNIKNGDAPLMQLPANTDFYGGGQLIYNPLGVDPSYIVRQLAILEGWEIGNIVQTAAVPCSDKFKMQGKGALEFITDVLIPVSVTPAGSYTTVDGSVVEVSNGESGFTAYFKNNKFYYEPLSSKSTRDLTDSAIYRFGYNIPNSPVISFQVETKGTAFYTNPVQLNALTFTGQETNEVVVATDDLIVNYNKVKGHQVNLDEFFGYTYERINDLYSSVLENYSKARNIYTSEYLNGNNITKITENYRIWQDNNQLQDTSVLQYIVSSDLIQKGLVTNYNISAENYQTSKNLIASAYNRIKQFTITADMTIWGDIRLSPNSVIYILNMVKSSDPYISTEHPSSGEYRIIKQTDNVSNGQFTQRLHMLRNDKIESSINKNRIDWSKPVKELKMQITEAPANTNTSAALAGAGLASILGKSIENKVSTFTTFNASSSTRQSFPTFNAYSNIKHK